MGTPPADLEFDSAQVRELLIAQHPDLRDLPLRLAASGWDNVIYRLGSSLALRLPRRSLAARLIENEQRWLPLLQPCLPLPVPAPVRRGVPQGWYPWCWSVIPWFDGQTADRVAPNRAQGVALATFFNALHVAAPAEAPRNSFRGVPLPRRATKFQSCLESLAAKTGRLDVHRTRRQPVFPRSDRACDLAAIWLLLPDLGAREAAMSQCAAVSAHTWDRARGWALLIAVILLDAGRGLDAGQRGDVRMARIGAQALERLLTGP